MPPSQIAVRRRQGNISSTPSKRPSSGSSAPMIGGSEAAFIVVVIVLAVIVILASIAIYCLLRKGEPSAADRAARRKYSIRGRGMRTHPLPIGLPGSLSEKIGSVFKGRRTGSGWVPARDEADEWDSTDEPLRVHHHDDLPYDGATHQQHQQHQREAYPLVGSAPPSHRATLTEASESLHTSRMASHVEDPSEEDFERDGPSIPHVQAPSGPDEVWLNARDGRGVLGSVGTGNDTSPMGYYAPQPRRADSGPEIPLFAGSAPFRHDI
ncbi:hypothetical protein BJY52DRAFT_1187166 [Lactarius psammicola]|nr:hypothetical protein BJY52DRAFT_1187166 [Lactarius psammicola]